MHILDLIAAKPLVWSLFALYVVATSWLAWRGHRTLFQSRCVGSS